jgi:hypothetical protein
MLHQRGTAFSMAMVWLKLLRFLKPAGLTIYIYLFLSDLFAHLEFRVGSPELTEHIAFSLSQSDIQWAWLEIISANIYINCIYRRIEEEAQPSVCNIEKPS